MLGGLKGNRDAIAETIENNVRSRIIKEHLSDPAYYEKMSALLDEIIALRKAKALSYEEYLKRVGQLARKVDAGLADDTPESLKRSPALRALYNNLQAGGAAARAGEIGEERVEYSFTGDPVLDLALRLDAAVKRVRHDGWRGIEPRERVIQKAMYEILQDEGEVERIFPDHQGAERVLMVPQIELGDITADVVLKDIKHVHLSVYPPAGKVRISAPRRMSLDTIRVFAISKLDCALAAPSPDAQSPAGSARELELLRSARRPRWCSTGRVSTVRATGCEVIHSPSPRANTLRRGGPGPSRSRGCGRRRPCGAGRWPRCGPRQAGAAACRTAG